LKSCDMWQRASWELSDIFGSTMIEMWPFQVIRENLDFEGLTDYKGQAPSKPVV
jgi:hypothetical protein